MIGIPLPTNFDVGIVVLYSGISMVGTRSNGSWATAISVVHKIDSSTIACEAVFIVHGSLQIRDFSHSSHWPAGAQASLSIQSICGSCVFGCLRSNRDPSTPEAVRSTRNEKLRTVTRQHERWDNTPSFFKIVGIARLNHVPSVVAKFSTKVVDCNNQNVRFVSSAKIRCSSNNRQVHSQKALVLISSSLILSLRLRAECFQSIAINCLRTIRPRDRESA